MTRNRTEGGKRLKSLPPIVTVILSICAVTLSICAVCAIAPPPQPPAQCCTPRVQTVNTDGTTWLCLIEEDTNGVERHRSCQMVNMREHVE